MSRAIQVSESSSDEVSSSDETDSDYESTYESVSINDSDSNEASAHDSPSTSMVKGVEITINIKPNRIQDFLRSESFLSTRAKKRHPKSDSARPKTKKPRTRAEVSAANNWSCGDCGFTCVSIEILREHVGTLHTQSKSLFYECKLCPRLESTLYTHYGKHHAIDFTENLLFYDGTVLVYSSVNTDNGRAAWFVTQKEKAEERLQGHKCRLCEFETEFKNEKLLKHHYTAYHKVDPKCLKIVKFLFRMEKNAHLVENMDKNQNHHAENVSTNKAKSPNKVLESKKENKDLKRKIPDNVPLIGLIMYVCKCGVAHETYDASVEHAQKHLAFDYTPNTKKCTRCDLTFECASFADHASRHGNKDTNVEVLKKIHYDFSTLLSNDWFNMFEVLAKAHVEKIVASSLFRHTRSVKLNWDSNTGIPLYKCGICKLFVQPAKVNNHSENYGACINFDPKGNKCTICNISFSTVKALKIHKDDHSNGGAFRVVIFNNKNDLQFNRGLKMMQHDLFTPAADSQETNEQEEAGYPRRLETNGLEKNVDAQPAQYCGHCNEMVLDYEDHIAGVKNQRKIKMNAPIRIKDCHEIINEFDEETASKEAEQAAFRNKNSIVDHDNSVMENNHTDDGVNIIDTNLVDIVQPWGSDSDSCDGGHPFITTQAQIHTDVNDYERRVSKKALDGVR